VQAILRDWKTIPGRLLNAVGILDTLDADTLDGMAIFLFPYTREPL
jgi:hypothetical protein